jgi:cytochrome c
LTCINKWYSGKSGRRLERRTADRLLRSEAPLIAYREQHLDPQQGRGHDKWENANRWYSSAAFGGFMMNDVHLSYSATPALCGVATTASKSRDRSRKAALAKTGCSLLLTLVVVMSGQPAFAANPTSKEIDELASAKGCYLCHRAKPARRNPDDLLPSAPSWQDIAQKYRRQKDAEDRLTQIVLEGSGNDGKDRHWKGKVSEVGMFPNSQEVDESQARNLVHWILSFAP